MLRLEFSAEHQDADLAVDTYGTLRVDGGVETVGLFALFVDARPGAQDVVSDPAGAEARKIGGWWAHQLLDPSVRLQRAPGSLLHRLTAYKCNAATARRSQAWAEQALKWLVDAGIADRVVAEATATGSRLALHVQAFRGDSAVFRSAWTNALT